MNKTTKFIIYFVVLIALVSIFISSRSVQENVTEATQKENEMIVSEKPASVDETSNEPVEEPKHPMSIDALRLRDYSGDSFTIEQTLGNGSNYRQFIASYQSEGLKIYGLLTIPLAPKPEKGFPAILFVHGYIPPSQYSTTGNYSTYQATLARSGFVTFKPDLRGHGNSEGEAVSAHYSEKYVIDSMFAISYLKNHGDVDPGRIGYWGHSNGGEIGLRVAVISDDVKAASFWAGVVGSYEDMFETYNDQIRFLRDAAISELVLQNGLPSENEKFWREIDPYYHLSEISAPIQIQHATGDKSVPIVLSQRLNEELEKSEKKVEYFEYMGDDHNIGANSGLAWQRSIDFFRKNL